MIKKISLIAAILLAAYPTMKAQTGKFLIGGSLGFSYSSDNPVSSPDVADGSQNQNGQFFRHPGFRLFLHQKHHGRH